MNGRPSGSEILSQTASEPLWSVARPGVASKIDPRGKNGASTQHPEAKSVSTTTGPRAGKRETGLAFGGQAKEPVFRKWTSV